MRTEDGSAGDADYGRIGQGYRGYRQPEPEFDAATTTFSVHQWRDLDRGLGEMRRVTCGPVIVMTCDPDRLELFWLARYAPEVIAVEARRYPSIDRIRTALGGNVESTLLPIPLHCVDGFGEAYYGRPEAILDPGSRRANSAWSFVGTDVEARFVARLDRDLRDGRWDLRHGELRRRPRFDGSLVLMVAHP